MKTSKGRKAAKYILFLIFVFNIFIEPVKAIETIGDLKVSAGYAIAIDCKSKIVLYEKNANSLVAMASTTKIMTALVAIKYGDLDKKVVISDKAAHIHGSTVGYKKGEMISIKELLFGLMLRSGNDASIAIAEGISGSVEEFVKLMNEYAMHLGLINSHFEVPHGLDEPYHYSTAYDLAILTAKAKEMPLFNEIVSQKDVDKKVYGFTRSFHNINKILWLLPEADGVKTGYTGNAGKCLVSSVKVKGNDVVIVVLNCSERWKETKRIFDYVNKNYEYKKFFSKGDNLATIKGKCFKKGADLICDSDIIIPAYKNSSYTIKVCKPSKDINLPSFNNKVLGSIEIYQDGKVIFKEPLKVKILK